MAERRGVPIQNQLISYITENQEHFYRVAYSYVTNREAALDIVQNAIVKALENYTSIRQPEYAKSWFYRILINECHGYMRKHKKELAYEPEALAALREEAVEENHDLEMYHQVLSLPEKFKIVIVLRFYEELSLKEIAKVTGCGISTVKYRLYKGLKKLGQNLKEETYE